MGMQKKILNISLDAFKSSADLVLTPELSLWGYPPKDLLFNRSLINKQDEVSIELVWTNNGAFANNERAILCPELATGSLLTGCIAVAGAANAGGNNGTQFGVSLKNQVATHNATTGTGSGLRIQYDTSAGGNPINIRVLDAGKGYVSAEVAEDEDKVIGEIKLDAISSIFLVDL